MTDLGYPVYDADNHLYEARDALTRHLDRKYKRQIQLVEVNGRTKLAICGNISNYIPNPTFEVVARPGAYAKFREEHGSGKTMAEMGRAEGPIPCMEEFKNRDKRLALMDQQGLHATLLHGTLVSALEERLQHDADLLHSGLHAFNQWLDEEWGFAYQERLFAIPLISLMDLDRACAELEWCLERGVRVVGMRPAPVPGYTGSRSPALPEFDPFWARLAESGVSLVMHASDSGYDKYAAAWEGGREFLPFEMSPLRMALSANPIHDTMAALLCHGLFDRHPNLRVISVENGAGWVFGLLRRLDRVLVGDEPASDIFKRHVWVAVNPDENVRAVADEIGVDHVLFGSDYPHPEGLAEPLTYLASLEKFSADEQRKIMSRNLAGLLQPRPR